MSKTKISTTRAASLSVPQVRTRSTKLRFLLTLGAFLLFMLVLLAALGGGVGEVELLIWLALVGVGVLVIIRQHRRAQVDDDRPPRV